ncbi:metallophosphoesterase [Micromonospora fulviviridis]|uniref:Metallophosphoesterase n=1 Tax=Micromonospora fulviviridis TaxID=47860 RepID=A0ABV2VR17_9ACTN
MALLVCVTQPLTGSIIDGDVLATATVNVTVGTSPGVAKTEWSLDGQYLLTDFQSPHQFALSSADFADGEHVLGVSAKMRDGYVGPETLITVTFANGNVTAPENTRQWSVPPIRARGPQEPFVVAAVGDGAGGEANAVNVTNALVGWDPDLFLYLGDVYDEGTLTEFRNWYGDGDAFFGRLRGVTTPVVGNHEYTGNRADGYFHFWDNSPHYYSYDANGWHFVAIDSTSSYNRVAPGTPQYEWLAADLAANRSPCTMVFWHHPLFSIGPEDPAPRMQVMWDLMASHHVTLLLSAHDHNYQRWTPMGAGGEPAADGVVELVVGGGGHSSQGFLNSDARVVKTNKSYGAMRMELFGNRADLRYHAAGAGGTTLVDSSTVSCKGADRIAPTAPTGLTSNPTPIPSVQLSWTGATDNYGVTGYRVYRDGAAVADLPATATAWTDAAVAGATRYEYTVDAVDAAGNRSDRGAPVAVTPRHHAPYRSGRPRRRDVPGDGEPHLVGRGRQRRRQRIRGAPGRHAGGDRSGHHVRRQRRAGERTAQLERPRPGRRREHQRRVEPGDRRTRHAGAVGPDGPAGHRRGARRGPPRLGRGHRQRGRRTVPGLP